jgi:ADP-heptose:LPS heptosyltransferase
MKKILIIHTFGLGDLILFAPFISLIKKNFPSHEIDFFSFERHAIEPIKYSNDIKNFYIADKSYIKSLKIALFLRNKYQYSIVTTGSSPFKLSIFSKIINAKIAIGEYTKIKTPFYNFQLKRNIRRHFFLNNLEIVKLILKKNELNYKLKTVFFLKKKKKITKSNLVGLAIGGGSNHLARRWDINNYVLLIRKLIATQNIIIKIFLSIKDKHLLKYFSDIKCDKIKIIYTASIQDIAREISECRYLVGNDNGFMHIASAFDVMLFLIIPKLYVKYNIYNFPYTKKLKLIKINSYNQNKNNEIDVVLKTISNYLEK